MFSRAVNILPKEKEIGEQSQSSLLFFQNSCSNRISFCHNMDGCSTSSIPSPLLHLSLCVLRVIEVSHNLSILICLKGERVKGVVREEENREK